MKFRQITALIMVALLLPAGAQRARAQEAPPAGLDDYVNSAGTYLSSCRH